MAGMRRTTINGANCQSSFGDRQIPKRGQVKAGIVVGLAHSFAAMFHFHLSSTRHASHHQSHHHRSHTQTHF
ncbi:hypothetical protein BVC80_1781g54 [Macleaya cordata]|uniref:Uncharacterized protein n=1 Tax=Macleaya cordata TaxID=56857 RepID=A0A200QTY8_MACCD|nr:hypothetical protein BVC80_1781g54 [Macleaya cordata]